MTQLATLPSGLTVPQSCISFISDSFVKSLQSIFTPDLCVSWNERKQRYVIEQCIEHQGSSFPNPEGVVEHSHLCRRIYVWLVRDEENGDCYMPLSQRVIEKLHEMETYRKYGTGPDALRRFREESARFDADQAQRQREQAHETMQYAKRHNRISRNRLKLWMERFDWLRPNK